MSALNRLISSICIALALGAAAGWWAAREAFPPKWDKERHYQRMLERFDRELRLTPEQRPRVEAILHDRRQKMKALREELRPRYEQIRASAQLEIRALLTPEQREKFDRMEAEWKEKKARSGRHRDR